VRNPKKWMPGDRVWLLMGDGHYPAIITAVKDYTEKHRDGYECQQYEAVVFFPHEIKQGAIVSHCMLTAVE
jgi:hypothetical protein